MNLLEQTIRRLPLILSKPLGKAVSHVLGDETFSNYLRKKDLALLTDIGEIKKILVVSDVNIGDAIIIQSSIEALKHYFPDSDVDYAYSAVADPIIRRNPQISNLFPIFRNPFKPSESDRRSVERLCREKPYDLVINFCPFLSGHNFRCAGCTALSPAVLVTEILRAKTKRDEPANLAFRTTEYVNQLFSESPENSTKGKYYYSGTKIYLSPEVLKARDRYLKPLGISPDDVIVFFNPDASNKYTFLDSRLQLFLLGRLLSQDSFDLLLLGSGITFKGIERHLMANIPAPLREKVIVLDEEASLDTYASLLDICDLFITGDTGPMHIAAARKLCVDYMPAFRNRTAVVGIFGSSDPEIYGYDSFEDTYVEANQDAPSKVFEATPDCKNITCSLQRTTNKCPGGRCFDGLNIDEIVAYIGRYLSSSQQ
jgi:hypothetical protein